MDVQEQALERQQKALYEAMGRIGLMRRGTLSEQRYPQRQARRNGHGASGPYFLWQGYVQGQRFAQRVGAAQARRLKAEIEARQRFEQLCAQYIALGEARAEHQRQRASGDALKKKPKPRSSRARKSRG